MNLTSTTRADRLVLALGGRLTFADAAHFPDIVGRIRSSGLKILEFDFSGLDFMDSSGMGLILTAYDTAHNAGMQVVISNARGSVLDGLIRARFDKLVTLR